MLQFFGMLGQPHSWSTVTQGILLEFQKRGIQLICKSTNKPEGIPPSLLSTLVEFSKPIKTETSFSYTLPLNLKKIDAKHRIQIYNYETTILPPGWAQLMNNDTHLILPSSQFAKDIFLQNGVIDQRMVVVPHGYDPLIFNKDVAPIQLDQGEDKRFKFLCVAAPHWRKGHDLMIQAYIEEFKNDEDVVLIIKSSMNSHETPTHFHVDLDKIKEDLLKTHKYKWPEIKLINYKIPSLAGLYKYADALVLPSRSECFSLTPLEASACKIPVITTDYGGHLDFLNHNNSYLIDYVLRKCPKEGQYHVYQKDALIAEPSIDDLRRLMRHVKNNYIEAQAKAQKAHDDIVDKYTWSNVADQIVKLIEERQWKI